LLIESADREEKLSKRLTSLEIEFLKNKQELENDNTQQRQKDFECHSFTFGSIECRQRSCSI
jgi:hypothetical protein